MPKPYRRYNSPVDILGLAVFIVLIGALVIYLIWKGP